MLLASWLFPFTDSRKFLVVALLLLLLAVVVFTIQVVDVCVMLVLVPVPEQWSSVLVAGWCT